MARNFDGVNDRINFGTDASIDGFGAAGAMSLSYWVRRGAPGVVGELLCKQDDTTWENRFLATDLLRFAHDWSGSIPTTWDSTTAFSSSTALNHICVSYDSSATTNDPTIYVNGTTESLTETNAPSGTPTSDAAASLLLGERGAGGADFSGDVMFMCYDSTVWTAADANRARWWGRPKGGLQVYHPFLTDKLNNEGSATANGTATGTTVVEMAVPTVRPGGEMGW